MGYTPPSPPASSPAALPATAGGGGGGGGPSDEGAAVGGGGSAGTGLEGFFILMTSCMMFLFLLMPVWNFLVLWYNEIYLYFIGVVPLLVMLASCLAIFCCYLFVIRAFFRRVPAKAQTAQAFALLAGAFITVVGLTLALGGRMVVSRALTAANDVRFDCRFSQSTTLLYQTAELLTALRMAPDCAKVPSVEQCEGFSATKDASLLKALETQLRCSTFCYQPHNMTTDRRSLFSFADSTASCQMMLARELQFYVADVGHQTYYEGCMLVLVAVIIGFLKVLGFCAPLPARLKSPAPDYGATRYVSQGYIT